ncbi:metallophosphoesterase [Shewanella sp. 202IG2-18]|uniref:metallophosphoesterase n=1 Tax=Parashewanella hymeniacidonis TaxID=2807618 RepID=UPI00195F2E7F|nr:metallophosphoesterase [Parashewanella hymeniacidonis]MBM7073870.1 metallophosphoesterase [Parashewanella hymeniacidonis]
MQKKIYLPALLVVTGFFGYQLFDAYTAKIHLTIPDKNSYSDGPYVFIEPEKLVSVRVNHGAVAHSELALESLPTQFIDELSEFKSNGKVAVLSDVHGQHDVFVTLIKNNNIIDENEDWSFGDGHFVITGDIFDRGPSVVETLWLIQKLEQQASDAGGKVHYLLGKHEYMVLQGDERYLHDKYLKTSELLKKPYKDLFAKDTVMGRWLRSKATVIKVDDTLYTHGGISMSFSMHNKPLKEVNSDYRKTIDMIKKDIKVSDDFSKYHNSESPIWYRGYFKNDLSADQVDAILRKYGASRIVVGHTSQDEIKKLHEGQMFAVDTSIKRGESGQILFLEQGKAVRGTFNGEQEEL